MKFHSSPRRLAMAAITLSAFAALPAVGQTINEDFKLLPKEGAMYDQFGRSVAISGTSTLVGDFGNDNGLSSGSVYLFDTSSGEQITKLLPNDGARGHNFGSSLAISGTTVVVGANGDEDNGINSGSAYLFDTSTWQQIAKLLPNDGAAGDFFGSSVAICGTTVVVGAPGDFEDVSAIGAAYLFDTITGHQIVKLLPKDGAGHDRFGNSVAISGNTALVGAYFDDDNGSESGSAYLFNTTTGHQIAKLLPSDGTLNDRFGWAVAISGNTAVVGAIRDDDNGLDSGSAYLFDTTTGQQIIKLLPSDGEASDNFGWSVAISGNTAVVGARRDDDNGSASGSAYLFDTINGQQIVKLLPSDGEASDNFGHSVAISDTTTAVGATGNDDFGPLSGSAYLFTRISPCSADLTNDGTLDFFDVSAFLTAYAASDPIADFNADGVFNFFDVSVFLTEYLAGCP